MNKKEPRVDPLDEASDEELKLVSLIHSALAGVCVAAVMEISTREQYNTYILISQASFAITIPFTLLVVLLLRYRALVKAKFNRGVLIRYWPNSTTIQNFRSVTYITGFIGFLAIFLNFHMLIGIIFFLSSMITFVVAWNAETAKSKQIKMKASDDVADHSATGSKVADNEVSRDEV